MLFFAFDGDCRVHSDLADRPWSSLTLRSVVGDMCKICETKGRHPLCETRRLSV